MMVEFATIQIHRDTKERIAALRQPGESFDKVLKRILERAVRGEEDAFLRELNAELADDDAFTPLA